MPKKIYFGRSQTRNVAQQRMKELQSYLQVREEGGEGTRGRERGKGGMEGGGEGREGWREGEREGRDGGREGWRKGGRREA